MPVVCFLQPDCESHGGSCAVCFLAFVEYSFNLYRTIGNGLWSSSYEFISGVFS